MGNTPASNAGKFRHLRKLIARQRRPVEDDLTWSCSVTDADRIRALEALFAKAQAGRLTPEEEARLHAIEALFARVTGANTSSRAAA
jgi:hypothetical protein